MSNLFDYINEFGSISFDEEMPNDVDNIIFCRLVYLDFSAHIGKSRLLLTNVTHGIQEPN